MKNFDYIKLLVGDAVTERDLQNVDCFVHNKIGLFIPSTGQCGYAYKKSHSHPSYMVVIVFSDRKGDIQVRKNHYFASVMSPDIPHDDIFDECQYYCLLIDKEYFEAQYKLYDDSVPRFEWKSFEMCGDILKALNMFSFECAKDMPNSDITLDAQSMIITHWIIRSILGENFDMRSVSDNYAVARAQQYISKHYGERITVKSLAALSYISVSAFGRIFKKETGLPPAEYIILERLEKSKTLLRRSNISVTDIAIRCGFTDGAHFSSCFKRIYGVSPSEYRNSFIK